MVYAHSIRHNLNWKAIEGTTQLISNIIDVDIPASKYNFKKLFGKKSTVKEIIHHNCKTCKRYLGTDKDLNEADAIKFCEICFEQIDLSTKHNFITIPVEQQLQLHVQAALSNGDLKFPIENIAQSTENNIISDVFDGEGYKRLLNQYGHQKFVTLTVNTDGAKVFKSTKHASIWPLQFHVNEISASERFKRRNMILTAIAYGDTPDMNTFLRPFVEEINQINASGGISFYINGLEEKLLVFPITFTLDSVAKCDVMRKIQFNGRPGCPYCYHKGTKIIGNIYRYCTCDNTSIRTNENTRDAMVNAYRSGLSVRGYKGISPLYGFDFLDLVWQIPIDKMHNSDLGVFKKLFFGLWFNSKKHGER